MDGRENTHRNRILKLLSGAELERLAADLEPVPLSFKEPGPVRKGAGVRDRAHQLGGEQSSLDRAAVACSILCIAVRCSLMRTGHMVFDVPPSAAREKDEDDD